MTSAEELFLKNYSKSKPQYGIVSPLQKWVLKQQKKLFKRKPPAVKWSDKK